MEIEFSFCSYSMKVKWTPGVSPGLILREKDEAGPRSARAGLEVEFAGELQDAGVAVTGNLTEGAGCGSGADGLHVGVIGHVERLGAELEVQPLVDAEVAKDTEIKAGETGAFDDAAFFIARNDAGGRGRGKCAGIEPRRRRSLVILVVYLDAISGVGVSNLVGTEACLCVSENAESGVIGCGAAVGRVVVDTGNAAGQGVVDLRAAAGGDREREAGVSGVDGGKLPSAKHAAL